MIETHAGGTEAAKQLNGRTSLGRFDWPCFPELESAAVTLPCLNLPGARTLARERWERLVTAVEIPSRREDVWRALTDPAVLRLWLAVCHGSLENTTRDTTLDFEDGEFFLCRPTRVRPGEELCYLWRWLGLGPATSVSWRLEGQTGGTCVTVTEEAINPPWDWQTWTGGGWPGILDQLAGYLRTGTEWRWPWRRMGPYTQIELPIPFYEAWERLLSPGGLRYWLQVMTGTVAPNQALVLLMGDASGAVNMHVREVIAPGQMPPSFLPAINFALSRRVWEAEVGGRLWLEPAGWGRCLLQIFLFGWDSLPAALQLSERKILTGFLAGAAQRACLMCGGGTPAPGPHSWS